MTSRMKTSHAGKVGGCRVIGIDGVRRGSDLGGTQIRIHGRIRRVGERVGRVRRWRGVARESLAVRGTNADGGIRTVANRSGRVHLIHHHLLLRGGFALASDQTRAARQTQRTFAESVAWIGRGLFGLDRTPRHGEHLKGTWTVVTARSLGLVQLAQYLHHVAVLRIAVSESFGERVARYFQLGDPVILICGYSSKFRFREDESFEVFCLRNILTFWMNVNGVESRLVFVHGVENYVSIIIHEVVGQFELVEADDLLHPLRTFGW